MNYYFEIEHKIDLIFVVEFSYKINAFEKFGSQRRSYWTCCCLFMSLIQRKGLPHAHFLIILKPEYKIRMVQQNDNFVSAEILDEQSNRHLHATVVGHMMHDPCVLKILKMFVCKMASVKIIKGESKQLSVNTTITHLYPAESDMLT